LLTPHVPFSDCRRDCAVDRRFNFNKGSQLFIGTHNEVLTGVAMRVNSEDCSSARIHA
jgi:hypothetical protein